MMAVVVRILHSRVLLMSRSVDMSVQCEREEAEHTAQGGV